MKSYLERKKRRNEIVKAIIVLFVVLFFLNYVMLYLADSYKFIFGLIFFGALDILAIWAFCFYLDIKPPKRKLPDWLDNQLIILEKKYDEVYERISSSQQSTATGKNEICPRCKAGKKDIVDKIRRVKGEVEGDFFLGFGSVEGETDTESVNHCNNCGHEWKKEETSYSNIRESVMSQILESMYYFFNNGEDNTSDELKKFSARAIKIFIKKHDDGYRAEELKKLSERELRKYGCP